MPRYNLQTQDLTSLTNYSQDLKRIASSLDAYIQALQADQFQAIEVPNNTIGMRGLESNIQDYRIVTELGIKKVTTCLNFRIVYMDTSVKRTGFDWFAHGLVPLGGGGGNFLGLGGLPWFR